MILDNNPQCWQYHKKQQPTIYHAHLREPQCVISDVVLPKIKKDMYLIKAVDVMINLHGGQGNMLTEPLGCKQKKKQKNWELTQTKILSLQKNDNKKKVSETLETKREWREMYP